MQSIFQFHSISFSSCLYLSVPSLFLWLAALQDSNALTYPDHGEREMKIVQNLLSENLSPIPLLAPSFSFSLLPICIWERVFKNDGLYLTCEQHLSTVLQTKKKKKNNLFFKTTWWNNSHFWVKRAIACMNQTNQCKVQKETTEVLFTVWVIKVHACKPIQLKDRTLPSQIGPFSNKYLEFGRT